jgi:hypothetical protein
MAGFFFLWEIEYFAEPELLLVGIRFSWENRHIPAAQRVRWKGDYHAQDCCKPLVSAAHRQPIHGTNN